MESTTGSILGVTYFGPVEGSPLIPPDLLTLYLAIFLFVLTFAYLILRFKGKEINIKQRLKKVFLLGIIIKIFVLAGIGLLAAYWFIPSPNIVRTSPDINSTSTSPNQKIEITFDRPVSRRSLEKSLSPEVPGVWVFEKNFYGTHLYRSVSFYPTQSLKADTSYQIKLANIENSSAISNPYSQEFSFKTPPEPKVVKIEPENNSTDIPIDAEIVVDLSNANDYVDEFDFQIEPKAAFDVDLDNAKKQYNLKFKESLKQNTKYTLKVSKTNISINPQTQEIIVRGETKPEYFSSFTTKSPPGIRSASPTGDVVSLNSPVSIKFSTSMDKKSVEEHFQIEPKVEGSLSWSDDQTLDFKPKGLLYEASYIVKIGKGTKDLDNGFFEQDSNINFTTIGPVKITSVSPANGWTGVSLKNNVKITFDQEVDKKSTEEKFSLSPATPGTISWDQNTLIFTPSQNFAPSTKYNINLVAGVKGVLGLASKTDLSFSFTTQDEAVKLAVPSYLQQHTLSCELSALRMALAFRGVNVSEDTLLAQVGVDPTPHKDNIWGDPQQAFVGNVDGNQMADGYGVHWAPIARVASTYRGAKDFTGASIKDLTDNISAGNPMVIWVYSAGNWPTIWNTPSGEKINALRDEHAVVVVGFVGKADNPAQIIVNDPLHGQLYWSRALFDSKWESFGRSGVVVY